MIKATYKIKHVIGDLPTVSEGESIVILVGIMVAGRQTYASRHGAGAITERLHLLHKQEVLL